MSERWDYPHRMVLFSEFDKAGRREFVVARIEPGVPHLLSYFGTDYEQAILIAEQEARQHGIRVYDSVGNTKRAFGEVRDGVR